jgi:hypothetical protein
LKFKDCYRLLLPLCHYTIIIYYHLLPSIAVIYSLLLPSYHYCDYYHHLLTV